MAFITIDFVDARRAVGTRRRGALVHVDVAEQAAVSRQTDAEEIVEALRYAHDRVRAARFRVARQQAHRAVGSGEFARTRASIAIQFVDARRVVGTRRRSALVDFRVALVAGETVDADAGKPVQLVDTGSVVLTRVAMAIVDVHGTIESSVANRTVAGKFVH